MNVASCSLFLDLATLILKKGNVHPGTTDTSQFKALFGVALLFCVVECAKNDENLSENHLF